jgi:hypothetical protein
MKYKLALDNLKGIAIKSIDGLKEDSEEVTINFGNDFKLVFYHDQDCCEYVRLEEYHGNIKNGDIFRELKVEEVNLEYEKYSHSSTATFIEVVTQNGLITMRWLGESNGYYSERCDMKIIMPDGTVIRDWQ